MAQFAFSAQVNSNYRKKSKSADFYCPICLRMIKAVRGLAKVKKEDPSKSFVRYCSLTSLDVEEEKFCYDTETLQQEISRLLDIGADEMRICKKIFAINLDFCKAQVPKNAAFTQDNTKSKRGFIFE
jgi:hypothetical protein